MRGADRFRARACASAKSFWTESFGGGDAAKEASERHAFHTPLLRVTLVAADGEVRFDPPLETVRDTVLAVFDDAVRAAEGLEDIRGRLAARRAAADPLLTDAERASVARPLMKPLGEWPEPDSELHELHELAVLYKATVADARDAIRATLEENFPGPEKIAERYRGFDELTPPKPEPERAPSEDAAKGAAEDGASAEMQPEAVAREEEDKATAEGGAGDGDAGAAPAEAGGEAETVAAEVAAEEEEEEEEEPAELTLPEIEDEAKRLAALAETVEKTSLNFEPFRMIGVSCVEIKATLAGAATAKRDALLQKLAQDRAARAAARPAPAPKPAPPSKKKKAPKKKAPPADDPDLDDDALLDAAIKANAKEKKREPEYRRWIDADGNVKGNTLHSRQAERDRAALLAKLEKKKAGAAREKKKPAATGKK